MDWTLEAGLVAAEVAGWKLGGWGMATCETKKYKKVRQRKSQYLYHRSRFCLKHCSDGCYAQYVVPKLS